MEDIYSDLDNYERVNDPEKIQAENAELKFKIESISHELEKLRENMLQDYDKLHIEYKKLETNYSSLLKTAKAEIERKTQLITTLNIEKDQLVFRYLSTNRYPPYRKNFKEKPNYHEKDSRNDNENMECEKSLKCDVQVENNDKINKKTKNVADLTCQNVESDRNVESKNINTKLNSIAQKGKSVLEIRNVCYSSFSSDNEEIDNLNDISVKKKSGTDSNKIKHSYDYSKRNHDKVNRRESRSRLPRDSRRPRNRYESRERCSTHRYRQREDWHYPVRNKETSPKPTRHYNFETREESYRKSRRDVKDIPQSPNGARQIYSSWDRQHQEHYYTSKNYHSNNENLEEDESLNRHFEKTYEEHHDGRKRKHKLKDVCDDISISKRRRDDEIPQDDIEKPINAIFFSSDVLQSPDRETVEDVLENGCNWPTSQLHEIKLVDPRLTSEKYVQITDMNNRTSLSTHNGRDVELKSLRYDHTENIHCTIPSSLNGSYQLSEDFTKELYENIDTQTSPEPGEIIECSDLVIMPTNNEEYLNNFVKTKRIEDIKKNQSLEATCLKSSVQTVEDDLELSEDSCDNNEYNSKNINSGIDKRKAKKLMNKHNLKQKEEDQAKRCDAIDIYKSVDKNQIICSTARVDENVVESNTSENEAMNMVDLKEQDSLITLEDLNVKSQSLCSDPSCFQDTINSEIHLTNEKNIESHNLNVISNNESCNTDHSISNVYTINYKVLTKISNSNTHDNDNNDDMENSKNVAYKESHNNVLNNINKLDFKMENKERGENNHSTTIKEGTLQNNSKNENEFSTQNQYNTSLIDASETIIKKDNEIGDENVNADGIKKNSIYKMDNVYKSNQKEKSNKNSKFCENTNKRKSQTKKERSDKSEVTSKTTERLSRRNKNATHEKSDNDANRKMEDCDVLEKTNRLCDKNDKDKRANESITLCGSFVENGKSVSRFIPENITREMNKAKERDSDDIIAAHENKNEPQSKISTNVDESTPKNTVRKKIETNKGCCNVIKSPKDNRTNKEKIGTSLTEKAKPNKVPKKKTKISKETLNEVDDINTSIKNNSSCKNNENVVVNRDVCMTESESSRVVNSRCKLNQSPEMSTVPDGLNVEIQPRTDNVRENKGNNNPEYVELEEMTFRTSTPTPMPSGSPNLVIDLIDNDSSPNTSQACVTEQNNKAIQSKTSDLGSSQLSNKESEAPVVRIFVRRKTSLQRKQISGS